jgi:hypothetical protein
LTSIYPKIYNRLLTEANRAKIESKSADPEPMPMQGLQMLKQSVRKKQWKNWRILKQIWTLKKWIHTE